MTLRILFKPEVTTPVARIAVGEFRRSFARVEQPFEVTDAEWEMLQSTNLFEVAPEAVTTTDQSSTEGEPAIDTTPEQTTPPTTNVQRRARRPERTKIAAE